MDCQGVVVKKVLTGAGEIGQEKSTGQSFACRQCGSISSTNILFLSTDSQLEFELRSDCLCGFVLFRILNAVKQVRKAKGAQVDMASGIIEVLESSLDFCLFMAICSLLKF